MRFPKYLFYKWISPYWISALTFTIIIVMCSPVFGQIKGWVKNNEGESLPFATVLVDDTNKGIVCNAEGYYEYLPPEKMTVQLTFQYVGYQKKSIIIEYKGRPHLYNPILHVNENILKELTIYADGEDPAYPIIRKAIEKKKTFKNKLQSLEADLYVKGSMKLDESPKKIMGQEIGNMGGILDSLGQGFVYLSESLSKYYFLAPNRYKELMIQTKKSGDNSMFSINQFSWAKFDIYEDYVEMDKTVVSPLADEALKHYRYRLDAVSMDDNGRLLYKIKIIPKSKDQPLIRGDLYIQDATWNLHSSDISVPRAAFTNNFIDSVNVTQIYTLIPELEVPYLINQNFVLRAGILGFKIRGDFNFVFSSLIPNKDLFEVFKTKETFRMEADALLQDANYWNEIRPIPLTEDEVQDYIKKDSLSNIWKSKTYLDSIDRINNEFKWNKVILGYTYNNTWKKTKLEFDSPLFYLNFNAVEGFNTALSPKWSKRDSTFRHWIIHPTIRYGFSDKKFKSTLIIERLFDSYKGSKIIVGGGKRYVLYDKESSLVATNNSWSSLWFKTNLFKIYQEDFALLEYKSEVINGLVINPHLKYTKRTNPQVNTQYSFRRKNQIYESNIPRLDLDTSVYSDHQYLKTKFEVSYTHGQTYMSFPFTKIVQDSKYPTLSIIYTGGIGITENANNFHTLQMRVFDNYVSSRLLGYFEYNFSIGSYILQKPTFFSDYFHPSGNQILFPINPSIQNFNLLPYFQYSTDNFVFQANYRHHFNGFISNHIPILKKTAITFTGGGGMLYVPNKLPYFETFIGLENFGFGPLKVFDIDYTISFNTKKFLDHGVVFRLTGLFQ